MISFRETVLPQMSSIFGEMNMSTPYSSVLDKAVIDINNWMLYGSSKRNCPPYTLTKVYDCNNNIIEEVSNKFGNLDLKELCAQPIKYAEEGVVVSPRVSFDWFTHRKKLVGSSKKFYLNAGEPYKAGSIFKAPMQAEVLRQIAALGSKGFYQSDITIDHVKSLKELGGVHTLADFENVKVQYVDPTYAELKDGSTLIELPPNGQGLTAIMMKKLI